MAYRYITYEVDSGIGTLTLNRSERLNALSRRMHAEIMDAADRWDADDAVRAVIITGAGKAFCSGTDVKSSWRGDAASGEEADLPPTIVDGIRRDSGGILVLRLYESKKPMIAAVNGVAVGIGATFILPMDVRIAADGARFSYVFTRRGICPESCSSWFLPRVVGIARALDWVNTGRLFPAQEALAHGLVSEVVPAAELLARARAIAREIADHTAPVSVAVSRQLLWSMLGAAHPMEAHEWESRALTTLITQPDATEAASAFVEKRAARFVGRPTVDLPSGYPWRRRRVFRARDPEPDPEIGFEVAALEAYLREALPELQTPLAVRRIVGGSSNPTFILTARNGETLVLRKKPPGPLLATAHQVDREHRVMHALRDTGVPVPHMRAYCADSSVIGSDFYVMDFVEGRIFRDATLPDCSKPERAAIYDSWNEALARLHQVDPGAVGLGDFGRPGNYYQRQFARWEKQYRAAALEVIPEMEDLIRRLPERLPGDSGHAIVHGDYRLENAIFHRAEPRLVAVLDWELSTLGDPLADLGHACVHYHTDAKGFGTVRGVDLEAAGIPTEPEFVAAYCRRTGRPRIDHFGFYVGFAMFRLASIAQGAEKRRRDGVNPRPRVPGAACVDWARRALEALEAD